MTPAERSAAIEKMANALLNDARWSAVGAPHPADVVALRAALALPAEETRPDEPCPAYWNEHKNRCGLSEGHAGPHLWSADVLWDEHQRGRREMASQVRDLLDSASPAASSPEEPPRVQGVSAAMRALAVETLANRGKPFPKDWAELGAAYEVEAGIVLDRAASEPAARAEGACPDCGHPADKALHGPSRCGGTFRAPAPASVAPPEEPAGEAHEEAPCPECGGMGRVTGKAPPGRHGGPWQPCPSCGGTGRAPRRTT